MSDETIFALALEQPDSAARAAFLAEACSGDLTLRQRVETLLRTHEKLGNFLDKPVVEQMPAAPAKSSFTQAFDASTDRKGPTPQRTEVGAADEEPADLHFLQPGTRHDSLGRLGHYEVLQVLGKGGFGTVFRAFDDVLQRVVAIKVLVPELAATSPARKRFLREARSSAQVRHENVVQVYAVEEQPLPHLVMEFIPGETLQQRLDRTGPLETPEVLQIGRQIAKGLAAAHAEGLVHRDIKPANVLIEAGPNGHVKITDFGLARAADDASLTQSGIIAGTPMFMAPEQAHGDKIDHRADLFSLGSVLYTMACGRPPFRANSTLAVLKRVAEDTPRPIPEIIPEVAPWLCELIAKLHAKKPADRIGTAAEVADLLGRGLEALQRAASFPPLPAAAPVSVEKAPRQETVPAVHTQRRVPAVWAAAVILLLLAGLGITEATGVTHVRGTVIRLFAPEGTLIVEVDDPGVSVRINGSDLVITGAGAREIRLPVGKYTVEAIKDGKIMSRELVSVTKDGKQVVRVSQEPLAAKAGPAVKAALPVKNPPLAGAPFTDADARRITALPPGERWPEVVKELKRLNPGYDGSTIGAGVVEKGEVTGVDIVSVDFNEKLTDVGPLKALPLNTLRIFNHAVSDLSPLEGKSLTELEVNLTRVADLKPLKGMPLRRLNLYGSPVRDLSPLKGMKLERLDCSFTEVSDLSPLKGMPLKHLACVCRVTDLSPLKGMKLVGLDLAGVPVTDLSPLKGMPLISLRVGFDAERDAPILRAIPTLETINDKPAAEFWKEVDAKEKGAGP